ncbi:SgcJ/EcaC family oxidoreductase [Flavobacterium sp. JAS]|uniref:YybH family protein n=1 Tax=Flavobacterium sp. JAS TaxID=2897329 RepID=UPI001E3F2113|nr:SgcJ/EcaC family oxidoreductase [Flavobacterium sp. JAS]MCD0469762.1 SgcJ/EcaC family oxidoreductase [Flavobacterium sp. JAS]
MKYILITATLFLSIVSWQNKDKNELTNKTEMETQTEKAAIEKLLFSYRDALNTSDVNKVLLLYTTDGVFMPTNAPTAIGQEQLKSSYEFVFKNIQLKIEFFIDEIEIHDNVAFVRTMSKGTTLIHANGQTVPEENRELFVLKKENKEWKISRYMFNKIK